MIENADDRYLGVVFPACSRKSEFVYPSCFDTFLKLDKEEKQNDIASDLKKWKAESGAVKKEALRQQYEKTQEGIRARQLAVRERKQKMAERTAQRSMGHLSRSRFN